VERLYDATFEVLESNKLEACYIRPLLFYSYGNLGLVPKASPVELSSRLGSGAPTWARRPRRASPATSSPGAGFTTASST